METPTTPAIATPTPALPPAEDVVPGQTHTAEDDVASLEAKIKLLTNLHKSVNDLRQVPGHLLRPQSALSSVLPILQSEQMRLHEEFEKIKSVSEKLRSAETQDALTFAKNSESKDRTGIVHNRRRREQSTTPSGAPSPESPQPYVSFQPVNPSLFPAWDGSTLPLKLVELPAYIKDYNRTHQFRLHIWSYRRRSESDLAPPIIVRFTIRDVLSVYVTLDTTPDGSLITESATVFGPREKKPPHSQSDYLVYQALSQQLLKMVHSQPLVPFQQVMSLLESYANLFVQRCSACQRVVSLEGHVPPVARIWVPDPAEEGRWDARHATCPRH
ncbi:hypothetical protein BXZ70DRAFT_897129 [Cristinia sonorae]|uniref:Mediator complex subunit 27 n=1 Tax=Cristinia sonorae TaxID=1940300 RepID=A0A8K0XN77_9AGAR|nr:hypothetical protein BXZ70DRAFT_897129 [Cristinia sonorae]